MLSDLEKERILTRDDICAKDKCNNDVRVLRKIAHWFDEAEDISFILEHMRTEKVNKSLTGERLSTLENIQRSIETIKNFYGGHNI